MFNLDSVGFWVSVYTLVVSLVAVCLSTNKLRHFWRTRHLQKVWGIKNGESVIIVCSELEEADTRQWVEPREFIYSLKYGDVDAYFEVVNTLLRRMALPLFSGVSTRFSPDQFRACLIARLRE